MAILVVPTAKVKGHRPKPGAATPAILLRSSRGQALRNGYYLDSNGDGIGCS
jgi:hypothetical protein